MSNLQLLQDLTYGFDLDIVCLTAYGTAYKERTRDLAQLQSGIRKILSLKPRDPGFLMAKFLN